MEHKSVHGLAVTRDGKKTISSHGGEEGRVNVWDVESRRLVLGMALLRGTPQDCHLARCIDSLRLAVGPR
ncbi:hypothetical protein JVT61DRAFT_8518 [Boletus reticuloceps]|uniref:Uncharacterized protein n=1 Tax=Boletus reticuloceps TaxID=495285 RepID=A0A8I2YYG5_9AGAM|nr:hypothetical protein JVT61DRAFT_8518 [Boletus reticuloceps]